MENNFTKEIVVLLLPLFFNKIKFENEKYDFLSLNEIVKENPSFDFSGHFEGSKESIFSLFEKIANHDFSQYILEKMEKNSDKSSKKMIFVNYPSNIEQFESLNSKLSQIGIKISKVVVSNFETFESFEKVNTNIFTCPLCFSSFEKSSCLSEEKSLICPFDGNKVSSSLSQKFNKSFSEYYFKNSLEFAQNLSSTSKKSDFPKIDIIPLIISETENFEEFLIKKMSGIV